MLMCCIALMPFRGIFKECGTAVPMVRTYTLWFHCTFLPCFPLGFLLPFYASFLLVSYSLPSYLPSLCSSSLPFLTSFIPSFLSYLLFHCTVRAQCEFAFIMTTIHSFENTEIKEILKSIIATTPNINKSLYLNVINRMEVYTWRYWTVRARWQPHSQLPALSSLTQPPLL